MPPWEKYAQAPAADGPWAKYGAAPQQEQAPNPEQRTQPLIPALSDSATGIAKGATLGFADEIQAALATPIELGIGIAKGTDDGKGLGARISDAYSRGLDRFRGIDKEAEARSPVANTVGQVAGGVATGGQLQKGGATLLNTASPTTASMVGRGAAEGAIYGGVQGIGTGEGLENRIDRGVAGAGLGALTGGVMGAVGARSAQKAADATVPSTEALKRASNAAYDAAEQAGVVVAPQSFNQAADDIAAIARQSGIDKTIHPKATAALARIDEARGQSPTLKDLDLLRRVVRSAASSNEADERRIAGIMIDKLDDYIGNLKPADVLAGDPAKATAALGEARDLWSRMRKGEIIEEMIDKAKTSAANFSGSGYENALRTQFRQLANNTKRMRGFTDAEQEAIQKVARGGPIENAARMLGKFAPRGVVSAALGGGIGFGMGGPIGSAALMGAGEVGRRAATSMTNRNAELAAQLVRSGGNLPQLQQLSAPQRAMIEALLAGQAPVAGGVVTGTSP